MISSVHKLDKTINEILIASEFEIIKDPKQEKILPISLSNILYSWIFPKFAQKDQ